MSGETLQQVRELLDKYAADDQHRENVLKELQAQVAARSPMTTAGGWPRILRRKSAEELNEDAIERLASFERLADDAAMTAEQKVALAISGWLVGANQATDNFQVAVSLAHVRDMVRQLSARADCRKTLPTDGGAAWTWKRRRWSAWPRSSS